VCPCVSGAVQHLLRQLVMNMTTVQHTAFVLFNVFLLLLCVVCILLAVCVFLHSVNIFDLIVDSTVTDVLVSFVILLFFCTSHTKIISTVSPSVGKLLLVPTQICLSHCRCTGASTGRWKWSNVASSTTDNERIRAGLFRSTCKLTPKQCVTNSVRLIFHVVEYSLVALQYRRIRYIDLRVLTDTDMPTVQL